MKTLLVTGALGYIGSHFCIEATNQKYNVIAIDTFTMENEQLDNSLSPYTVLYDINQQNKMVQYLDSKSFEDKKIFNGSMGFKTLIFINEKN